MQRNIVAVAVLSLFSSVLGVSAFFPVVAQDPPAQTYQPGFWQPVADFNAKKKVTINLTNQTEVALEYGIAGNEENLSETVKAGQTQTLETTDNSVNIAIYPKITVDPDKPYFLKFKVTTDAESNTINVNILKGDRGFMGHRSINLQKTGKIYLY